MRIYIIATSLLLLAACGGRAANPVASYQPGDDSRSCDGLKAELAANEAEIARLLPDEDATGKNVVLGVAGAFLIVPWFFMDFKDAEGIEIRAYRRRNVMLRRIASKKSCSVPPSKYKFQQRPPSKAGEKPRCDDVGGYEEYYKRTGNVCMI